MSRHLIVVLEGRVAGALTQTDGGWLTYRYDDRYLNVRPDPTPLSLSMPLTSEMYRDRVVRSFLDNLLPDNEDIRRAWARQYHVSEGNPFALLEHIGEECAGAVQFVTEDRLEAIVSGGYRIVPLTEIERWIGELRRDPGANVPDLEGGQFSLAGAKAKFGLLRLESGEWALPHGATPTSHVIKPAQGALTGQELNEHACLELARRSGVFTSQTSYLQFGDESALVATRYDRLPVGDDQWRRVHQEDLCQALGLPPHRKYQRQNHGPGIKRISATLRGALAPSAARAALSGFAEGLMLNWLVGGTDAHAKNYSLLLSGRDARFAPLYDVASWLPYRPATPQIVRRPGQGDHSKLVMAMSVNGKYESLAITREDWMAAARLMDLVPLEVVERGRNIAARLAEQLHATMQAARETVEDSNLSVEHLKLIDTLELALQKHIGVCSAILDGHPVRR